MELPRAPPMDGSATSPNLRVHRRLRAHRRLRVHQRRRANRRFRPAGGEALLHRGAWGDGAPGPCADASPWTSLVARCAGAPTADGRGPRSPHRWRQGRGHRSAEAERNKRFASPRLTSPGISGFGLEVRQRASCVHGVRSLQRVHASSGAERTSRPDRAASLPWRRESEARQREPPVPRVDAAPLWPSCHRPACPRAPKAAPQARASRATAWRHLAPHSTSLKVATRALTILEQTFRPGTTGAVATGRACAAPQRRVSALVDARSSRVFQAPEWRSRSCHALVARNGPLLHWTAPAPPLSSTPSCRPRGGVLSRNDGWHALISNIRREFQRRGIRADWDDR
jgi:hypothetical protein